MIRLLFFLFFLLPVAKAAAQTDTLTDPAGKAYFLLPNARLVTANPLGQNSYTFYDSSLGRPTQVDVTNPFEIILSYPDYGVLVLLDRTLNEVRRLDLFASDDFRQPGLLARAFDNAIWIFDDWDYKLKLLDRDGNLSQQSNDLRLEIGATTPPESIQAVKNRLYLRFADHPDYAVFTAYGRFVAWELLPGN